MRDTKKSLTRALLLILFCLAGLSARNALSQSTNLPAATTIPIQLTHTIDAGKVKAGDSVRAKTTQEVVLADGKVLPKGSFVVGHIVEAQPFIYNETPYAKQMPSSVAVQFDRVELKGDSIPAAFSVRAMADPIRSSEAYTPQFNGNINTEGATVQIGGDQLLPSTDKVFSARGDIVGYSRKNGVFARLLPNEYVSAHASYLCSGSPSEQAVGIFSANACGLYGFSPATYISENGGRTGVIRLESRRHTVELNAGTTALLQAMDIHSERSSIENPR